MKTLILVVVTLNICLHLQGVVALVPVQLVSPYGIESVNGSDINMGCTSQLVDSDGVMICDRCSNNYLIDGDTPAIDTSSSDWASQLVTVRKTQTDEIPFDHVLLTFRFDTAVFVNEIELDFFRCPEMGISVPTLGLYIDEGDDLVFAYQNSSTARTIMFNLDTNWPSLPTSCDSLTTVPIGFPRQTRELARTIHILINFSSASNVNWTYVGEVRFTGTNTSSLESCPTASMPTSSTPLTTDSPTTPHVTTSGTENLTVPTTFSRSTETCNESVSSVIVVSTVSLLVIVTLITVNIIQCLLILRIRKSDSTINDNDESLKQEYANSSKHMNLPVTPNVAYSLHKTRPIRQSEDRNYEIINTYT